MACCSVGAQDLAEMRVTEQRSSGVCETGNRREACSDGCQRTCPQASMWHWSQMTESVPAELPRRRDLSVPRYCPATQTLGMVPHGHGVQP